MTRQMFASDCKGVHDNVRAMADMVDTAIERAVTAFRTADSELARSVVDADEEINQARWSIEEDVVLIIARQAPMARDLRELITGIHVATELERIGDYAKVVARTVASEPIDLEIRAIPRILELADAARQQLSRCMEAFDASDPGLAREVAQCDEELDELWKGAYRELIAEMIADSKLARDASELLWIAHNLERMGDRVTNICERIVYAATGQFEENVHLGGPDGGSPIHDVSVLAESPGGATYG